MKILKKLVVALTVTSAIVLSMSVAMAASHYDNWKGTLSENSSVSNFYDGASGRVILNYRSGKDTWVVNLNAWGLMPGVSYQVIQYDGSVLSLGCFVAEEDGSGHLSAKGFAAEDIDPMSMIPTESRINVRLDNPGTAVCDGIGNSAVLTTYTNSPWNGSGLDRVGSSRPRK